MQSLKRIPNGTELVCPAYEPPWRNGWEPYTQHARIDEIPQKLRQLLERYGEAFDDHWWYYVCTRGRGKGLFIRRVPIWQTTKRMPTEKPKPFPVQRNQKRLTEVIHSATATETHT